MSLFKRDDVTTFRCDRLMRLASSILPGISVSDEYILGKLQAAEADISHKLKVLLEPTTIFPYEPTAEEIAELNGAPWLEEPGYDYDPQFFRGDRWGFLPLRHKPTQSVEWARFAYPSQRTTLYELPREWIRIDKRAGTLNFVPTTGAAMFPMNTFIIQALGGGRVVPFLIQVKYVAGLAGVKSDPRWADLLDVITKTAALKVVEDQYLPQSRSVSGDGLSQSLTVDVDKYHETLDAKLFGGKGSNGGLWSTIHGLVTGAVGVA